MLSIERTKELTKMPIASDQEIEIMRDSIRSLVEIIFEKWLEDKYK